MKVLSHRGYWHAAAEKNQPVAFKRSFALGYGTETDVRDAGGHLVISHDMAGDDALPLGEFLRLANGLQAPLAMNIKADGLAAPLARAFADQGLDWFAFDMSVPDMRAHLQQGNPVFGRMSEVERDPPWFDALTGIWLDGFDGVWFDAGLIRTLLGRGKQVCVVSPELHRRSPEALWDLLVPLRDAPGLMLCTDLPERAEVALGLAVPA